MKNILTEKFSKKLLIAGAFLLLVGFILFVWNDWSFSTDEKLKTDKIAQFGDFIQRVLTENSACQQRVT